MGIFREAGTTVKAPVLLRDRMTEEEFFHLCDEDTKANLTDGVMIVESSVRSR